MQGTVVHVSSVAHRPLVKSSNLLKLDASLANKAFDYLYRIYMYYSTLY